MPVIEHSIVIDAPIEKVFAIARDAESYPEFMPDVKSIEILEKSDDGNELKTRWAGRIPQFGLTVKWTQQEKWDPVNFKSEYKQIEGDYDKMEGWWKFAREGEGTRFDSWLDYEYNVPLVGPLLHKVVKHIVEQNIDGIMKAIKQRAEST
ncbi:MAG: SRPBCC family protein [Fimbriimonadales bacterium]|nr:SRPBCC family protein [Fimbriimonadales bacterium]